MQGCTARIINGFCVEPAQRSELLQMTCSSDDKDVAGTSGVSN
jgi:hypothetical protein